MFHALVKDLDRSSHCADHPASDDALSQFEVMKAEQVHALIEVEEAFCDIVQSEKLVVPAVQILNAKASLLQLQVERLA